MASDVDIGGDGSLFIGEDKILVLEVLDSSDIPVDIATFTMVFNLRTTDDAAAITITKAVTVTGTYNASRSLNTQRANVTLGATDLSVLTARQYRYSVKRTDIPSRTVIIRGDFFPEIAT